MSISRRNVDHSDDEENIHSNLSMIGRSISILNNSSFDLDWYLVVPNRRLEELIASYDDHSTIDLSCQKLIDRDMAIILKHAVLEKQCRILNLWGNQFTPKSLPLLCRVLNDNQILKELDLSHNRLGDHGVQIISDVLSLNNSRLKELDLSSNEITDQGARYLSSMLSHNSRLKRLILNRNEITNEGFLLLANALVRDNQKLIQLKLEANPYITRTGVLNVLHLLRNNHILEDIYVKDCSIIDEDFSLIEQRSFNTGFDIIVSNRSYSYL